MLQQVSRCMHCSLLLLHGCEAELHSNAGMQGLNRLAHSLVWASARGQQPGHSRHSPALTIRAYAAQPGAAQQVRLFSM